MKKNFIIKSHVNQEGKKILSIIDEELLGKNLEEEEIQLDLNSNFFKGEKIEENDEKIMKEIETSYMIIAVGEKTTSYLEQKNLISKSDVKKINNVPYVYILARKE